MSLACCKRKMNFKVDDFHTYFVGESLIFVHNAQCAPRSPKSDVMEKVEHEDGSITYTKSVNGENVSVTYNSDGYPDFSPYTNPDYPDPVPIKMTGDNYTDFKAANQAVGRTGAQAPEGYTWHHMEDGKNMLMVRTDIHSNFPHTGGASLARAGGV